MISKNVGLSKVILFNEITVRPLRFGQSNDGQAVLIDVTRRHRLRDPNETWTAKVGRKHENTQKTANVF